MAESDSAELEQELYTLTSETCAYKSNDAKTWKEERRQETKRKEEKNGPINMPKYNDTLSPCCLRLQ